MSSRQQVSVVSNAVRRRVILYACASLIALTLLLLYRSASKFISQPEMLWPNDGYSDWVRDVDFAATPEELSSAISILQISYVGGKLYALCAYKNVSTEHGVQLNGVDDADNRFWPNVTLEASLDGRSHWEKISEARRSSESTAQRILAPGTAIRAYVNLDAYRNYLMKYRAGRIVTESKDSAVFQLDMLCRPSPPARTGSDSSGNRGRVESEWKGVSL